MVQDSNSLRTVISNNGMNDKRLEHVRNLVEKRRSSRRSSIASSASSDSDASAASSSTQSSNVSKGSGKGSASRTIAIANRRGFFEVADPLRPRSAPATPPERAMAAMMIPTNKSKTSARPALRRKLLLRKSNLAKQAGDDSSVLSNVMRRLNTRRNNAVAA